MKPKKRMERNIGHEMRLCVIADADMRVIDAVIDLLERYLRFCRMCVDEQHWRCDGGEGSGRQVGRRWVYRIHVGPSNSAGNMSPPYPERINALLPLLALAKRVKDTGGDIEELREALK